MQKLKIWEVLKERGSGDKEISQLLRVSRATLYRWRSRLRQKRPKGLEEKSRRPHCIRKPRDYPVEQLQVKAIQVDGGSEYRAEFEEACQRLGLKLFVLPPPFPKLNGRVERAHRTHLDEFYAVIPDSAQVDKLNIALYKWERVYNQIRPH